VIVTIDGPAGTGKSSVAHALARALGLEFLDTGAMYRAVTLIALRAGIDPLRFFRRSARDHRLRLRARLGDPFGGSLGRGQHRRGPP
jgi:cytidylate kinase